MAAAAPRCPGCTMRLPCAGPAGLRSLPSVAAWATPAVHDTRAGPAHPILRAKSSTCVATSSPASIAAASRPAASASTGSPAPLARAKSPAAPLPLRRCSNRVAERPNIWKLSFGASRDDRAIEIFEPRFSAASIACLFAHVSSLPKALTESGQVGSGNTSKRRDAWPRQVDQRAMRPRSPHPTVWEDPHPTR